MRRVAALFSGWAVATLVAVAIALQGVGFVSREVTGDRPAALSASEVLAELERPAAPTADGLASAGGDEATGETLPVTTTTTSTTTTRPVELPTSTSTAKPSTTPTVPAPPSQTRTYDTTGGSTAIRFEPGRVTLVWATPHAGFEARVDQSSPGDLSVRFRSDEHESRVDASWEGGPVDEVEENPR